MSKKACRFLALFVIMPHMGTGGSPNLVVRIFTSRFFLLGAFLIALIVAVSFGRAFYKDYEIRQQIKALQAKVDTLERTRLESLNLLDYVKSDAYVEDVARRELNLKKSGERVIVVDTALASTSTLLVEERSATPSWQKWWGYFVDGNRL